MTSKQREEVCSECDANATWYCIQDNANFCDQHNTAAHSLKSQKLHKVVSIDEKDAIIKAETAKPMNCKNHHMPLFLYCLACKVRQILKDKVTLKTLYNGNIKDANAI